MWQSSPAYRGPGRGNDRKCTEGCLGTDHNSELNMTHDTDVLEPEPARPGGLVRKDLVGEPWSSIKPIADLGGRNHTPFANQQNLWSPLRRDHPI